MRILLPIIAALLFINAGFQSTSSEENPEINFSGFITTDGESTQALNITISGIYKGIKMYSIPTDPAMIPTLNVTTFDLHDIQEINHVATLPTLRKFHDRDYVEIAVTTKDGTTHNYLVERTRKLYYQVPLADASLEPLKREVALEVVNKVVITGYKAKDPQSVKRGVVSRSAAQEALCKQAHKDLHDLEEQAGKSNNPGYFTKLIQRVKETIFYLCG